MTKLQKRVGFAAIASSVCVAAIVWAFVPVPAPVADAGPGDSAAPVIQPVVIDELVHDPGAFTEGFELGSDISGGTLYEGTGEAGSSQLRELDPSTGELRRAVPLPNDYFGEGVTVVGDRIWQLTYQDGVAIEWDRATLSPIREVPLAGEGWGLCYDGSRLIRSDGTDRLRFHNPADMTETGGVDVTRDGQAVTGLNELECVDGAVWANLWPSDEIARIDPATGTVNLIVDAAGLRARGIPSSAQVLNGIAHVQGSEFLLTGKDWPKTFRVHVGQ